MVVRMKVGILWEVTYHVSIVVPDVWEYWNAS
jgi:hypothetical protein